MEDIKKINEMVDYYANVVVKGINGNSDFHLDKDDIKQELWIKILKVENKHDPKKAKFKTFINTVLQNEIKLQYKRKSHLCKLNHLEENKENIADESNLVLFGSDNKLRSVENKIMFKIQKEEIYQSLNDTEKEIFDMLTDYSREEVRKKIGFNNIQNVTNIIRRNIRPKCEKLREYL